MNRRMTARRRSVLLSVLTAAFLAACGAAAPPPSPPTLINAHVSAALDVNPDRGGSPSPIVVRLYELSAPSEFLNATFVDIYEADERTLGADLRNREELFLQPGGSTTVRRPVNADTRYVGVLAAYQDIDTASWRALTAVAPNTTTSFSVRVERDAVSLEPLAASN